MEIVMIPTYAELEVRLTESHQNQHRCEMLGQHLRGVFETPDWGHDLSKPAFPQWRTAVQMAFAVSVTMLTLFAVFASIVAISRA
jgi:hypothetical protein